MSVTKVSDCVGIGSYSDAANYNPKISYSSSYKNINAADISPKDTKAYGELCV